MFGFLHSVAQTGLGYLIPDYSSSTSVVLELQTWATKLSFYSKSKWGGDLMDKTLSIKRDLSSDPQSSCKKLGMVVVSLILVFLLWEEWRHENQLDWEM